MTSKAHAVTVAGFTALLFAACGASDNEHVQGPASEWRKGQGRTEAQADSDRPITYADQNRDGRVTRAEAKADKALLANFERYDANDNGELDRGEFARLEEAAADRRQQTSAEENHQLRPRREFPRPMD